MARERVVILSPWGLAFTFALGLIVRDLDTQLVVPWVVLVVCAHGLWLDSQHAPETGTYSRAGRRFWFRRRA